tara:strand:+ start:357 stop:770 length:414 start_codon:yes stop_codon:yes gene_type:complete
MAHFARINADNIVVQKVVVSNDDITDENGVEQESLGQAFLRKVFNNDDVWKQTSYNRNFRVNYAGKGMVYDEGRDMFYYPTCQFPNWILNYEDGQWHPPVPIPDDETEDKRYIWNIEENNWVPLDKTNPLYVAPDDS